MNKTTISIAKEFSPQPLGRLRADGPFPGEAFREDILLPALLTHDVVEVDFDGTSGFGSSFLEEAFGGLLRRGIDFGRLEKGLLIHSSRKSYEVDAWNFMREAAGSHA